MLLSWSEDEMGTFRVGAAAGPAAEAEALAASCSWSAELRMGLDSVPQAIQGTRVGDASSGCDGKCLRHRAQPRLMEGSRHHRRRLRRTSYDALLQPLWGLPREHLNVEARRGSTRRLGCASTQEHRTRAGVEIG